MIENHILLASGSPRRSYLLTQLDLDFRVIVSNVEEVVPEGMPASDVPEYLAQLKGKSCVARLEENEILLAADTIVIHEDEILGKPVDQLEAKRILNRLSGGRHSVITGVYLTNLTKSTSFSVKTDVGLDQLSEAEIEYYVQKYQPLDKAGSYGIQEWIGWAKINRIEGSYSNIMGLPTREVFQALSNF